MSDNTESKNQLPWDVDPNSTEDPVKRGRKPGQLKGMTYNVPRRKQISVSLLERDIQKIDLIAREFNVARSKVITELINTHPRVMEVKLP
tara:strand:+ start:280 stop:549 length:270 start_codon:yes stop_codon:yes gene_type:complete